MTPARNDWRTRRLGTPWQFGIFHLVIRWGGRAAAYPLSDIVSLYYVLAHPSVRVRCRSYISRRFPDQKGTMRLVHTYRLLRSFARTLVDRATIRITGCAGLWTSFAGKEALRNLLAEGKGLVIVTAHAGAWQLGMGCLPLLGKPVAILTRREPTDEGNPFSPAPGEESPFRLIDPEGFLGGVTEMLGILQAGGVVCIMGDRPLGSPSGMVTVPFLGDPIHIPYSPYRLASATGAPVAVLFPFKPKRDQFEMRLACVIRIPPDLGRGPAAYRPFAEKFTTALTAFVQAFPYDFFNFFDLWKEPPESLEKSRSEPRSSNADQRHA